MSPDGAAAEPHWITQVMLMAIHARQIERYGGAHGVLDEGVVHSALARPRHPDAYQPAADLADFAAAYLVEFGRARGSHDGNKRTGLARALVLLSLNGSELQAPPEELHALTMSVATGRAEDGAVAA